MGKQQKIKLEMLRRPNKTANGFTKHYERREKLGRKRPIITLYSKQEKADNITRLIVRGTLDLLAARIGILSISRRIKKEHPIDKGYFKEIYIISEYGKRLYKRHITNH